MSGRLTLDELRRLALLELDGEWVTTTQLADELGLGHGVGWYRLALVLERLVNDGHAELRHPGSTVRRFRRRRLEETRP